MVAGQPAHLCCLTRLYTVGRPTSIFIPTIPKIEYGPFQKQKLDKSVEEIQQVKD
jgi:hypothetical protein